jgi:hypothetical protein
MLRAIAILLLSLVAGSAADARSQRDEFRLNATVLNVVMLSAYSGAAMPVDFDPQFAVTMRVRSIMPSLTNFTKGATVTFAVHSPSLLFGSTDAKGKTYDFTLRRETSHGKTSFSSLEVRR